MDKIVYKVFICAIISVANSFLLPDQYELVYDYHTETSASIIGNDDDATDFTLNATITLKTYDELTFVTLSNVQCSFFMGDDNLAPTTDSSKMDSLVKPFVIRYQSDGKIDEILMDKDDELWSINIKKGIASLFQLDMTEMAKNESLEEGFNNYEVSLNGMCTVSYVLSKNYGGFEIIKHIDLASCLGQTWFKDSEIVMGECDSDTVQPITAISTRKYTLDKIIGDLTILGIKNENSITNRPMSGGSYIQLIWAEQNLMMVKKEKLNDAAAPSIDGMIDMTLIADFVSENDKKYDLTGGRMINDNELMMAGLKVDIEELAAFNKTYAIDEYSPMSNKPDLMNFIVRKMEILDEDQLNTLLANLEENEEAIKIFYKSIPKVGTHSSLMFIKNYIIKNPSIDKLPEDMLDSLASSWKTPDVDIVKEYFALIEPETKLDEILWDKMLLVVSSMLSKVKKGSQTQEMTSFFINKYQSTSDELEKMKYIAAMKNIKAKSTTKFMMSIITGDSKATPFIKTLTIWALKDVQSGLPDILDSLYLPLISKKDEHFTVRCASMDVYIEEPTVEKLMKLAFAMAGEDDENVMSAFRTRVKSLANSKLPCNRLVAEYAKQLLLDFPGKDRKVFQGTVQHIFDHSDPYIGISRKFTFATSGHLYRDGFFTMMLDPIPDFVDVMDSGKSLFVRGQLNTSLSEPTPRQKYASWLPYFGSIIEDAMDCSTIIWNIIAVKDGNVVDIFDRIGCPTNEPLKRFLMSFSHMDKQVVMPTDAGLPAVFFVQKNTKDIVEAMIELDRTTVIRMDLLIMTGLKYGMKFYNPAANIWQGVKRNLAMDMEVPFLYYNNRSFSHEPDIYKEYSFLDDVRDGKIINQGFKTHVHTGVFVEDLSGQWKKDCPTCKRELHLTKKGYDKKGVDIFKFDMPGTQYELALFDCEKQLSESKIANIQRSLLRELNRFGSPEGSNYYSWRQLYKNVFYMPMMDTCGVRLLRKPNYPITEYMWEREYFDTLLNVHTTMMSMLGKDDAPMSWKLIRNITSPMKFSAIVAKNFGEDQTPIHIDADQEFDNFTVKGEYRIFTEDTEDPTDMTVSFKSENLNDDKRYANEKNVYDKCVKIKTALECAQRLTYLQNYDFEIKYKSISKRFFKWYQRGLNLFHALYSDHLVSSSDMTRTDTGMIKIQLTLTETYDAVDVRIMNELGNLDFKDLPLDDLLFDMILAPISSHFTFWDIFERNYPPLLTSTVTKDSITMWTGEQSNETINANWTEIISYCDKNENKDCDFQAFAHIHPENKLTLRVVLPDGVLEAHNVGLDDDEDKDNIGLLWNNDVIHVNDTGYYYDDRFRIKLIDGPRMFLGLKDETIVIDFTNTKIHFHFPTYFAY